MMRWLLAGFLSAWIGLAAGVPAFAQASLESAKQAGLIGERQDGLVGFVGGTGPADLRTLVEQVNAQRLQRYGQVAQSNGTSVSSVQALAGRQLIERSPAGQYIMTTGGRWVKK